MQNLEKKNRTNSGKFILFLTLGNISPHSHSPPQKPHSRSSPLSSLPFFVHTTTPALPSPTLLFACLPIGLHLQGFLPAPLPACPPVSPPLTLPALHTHLQTDGTGVVFCVAPFPLPPPTTTPTPSFCLPPHTLPALPFLPSCLHTHYFTCFLPATMPAHLVYLTCACTCLLPSPTPPAPPYLPHLPLPPPKRQNIDRLGWF